MYLPQGADWIPRVPRDRYLPRKWIGRIRDPKMIGESTIGESTDHRLSGIRQCQAGADKANHILTCIKRGIYSRDKSVLLPLNKTLVQPHLEYNFGHQSTGRIL